MTRHTGQKEKGSTLQCKVLQGVAWCCDMVRGVDVQYMKQSMKSLSAPWRANTEVSFAIHTCNILQHPTVHCNTLQQPAKHKHGA